MVKISASKSQLSKAKSYKEWQKIALELDEKFGHDKWKEEDRDPNYDFRRIRERLDMLKIARKDQDDRELLFALNEGIHGNLGGIANNALYDFAYFGTKNLISDYLQEVEKALLHLADVDDDVIPFEERLDFFRRASHCYGRSALMLSGAGSLAPFHIGVLRALHKEGLLPSVISGASGGAFMAGIIGTRPPEELDSMLSADELLNAVTTNYDKEDAGMMPTPMSIGYLARTVENLIPDLTFEEAFEESGLYINISVAPTQMNQTSRLLNVITSPHVYVREAVVASCSVPGVFPPVRLAAKNFDGNRKTYLPELEWIDGSVAQDMPVRRLGRLYGVNHFIASQTNPIVLWAVRDTSVKNSMMSIAMDWWDQIIKANLKLSQPVVKLMTRRMPGINSFAHMFYSVALQQYTADVNIIPRRRIFDPRKILSQISAEETMALIQDGEVSTWPKIELIRNSTRISRALDDILERYERELETHALTPIPGKSHSSGKKAA